MLFISSRFLVASCSVWPPDKKAIHNVFNHRAKMNGLASKGEWSQSLEA